MTYLCCSIFSFAGTMFLLCMGALLRLQPEFIRDVHTPKSSANSCFVSAGLYAGVFLGSLILWRREQHVKGSSVGEVKDTAPFELFSTPLMYDEKEDSEEVAPLMAPDSAAMKRAIQQQRRVPNASTQEM